MADGRSANSRRSQKALEALEQRLSATKSWVLELDPPPQPVPRRKRPFIVPNQVKLPPPPAEPVIVLDGFALLEACRVDDPDKALKAVLEGCGISTVVCEDLAFFRKLTHLDLGDNHVQIRDLAYLPSLKELHLDCNGMTQVEIPPGGFPWLEVLNLSFNGLGPDDVLALADIPRLRQLDISHNELTNLPQEMSGFKCLQVLNCESNLISSERCWLSLSRLPGLVSLSLSKNKLSTLPERLSAGFSLIESIDISHNLISHEEQLVPLITLPKLRSLAVYGNPFVPRGASAELHEAAAQRSIAMATLPPPPLLPPGKVDLRQMRMVAEAPSRRRVQLHFPKKPMPRLKPMQSATSIPPPKEEEAKEVDAESFFLTSADSFDTSDVALQNAQAQVLAHEDIRTDDLLASGTLDIRSAVTALKHALERPSMEPVTINANHLKLTESVANRRRERKVDRDARQSQRWSSGMGGNDMGANLSHLQQRASSHNEGHGQQESFTTDADGDAGVSAMVNVLGAMHGMSVGSGAAPPAHPGVV